MRAWEQLTGRMRGPMWIRFLVPPAVLVFCSLLLGGPAAAWADVPKYGVKVKVNKRFDFRSLKTYCWRSGWPSYDDALHRVIVLAVDRELAARGLLVRAEEPCDVIATYASLQRTDVDLHTRAAPGSKLRREYDVGTLVVLLKRPQSGIELFRARLDTPLEADRLRREDQVSSAVVKMFDDYPIARTGHHD